MAVHLQFRSDGFATVSSLSGRIEISAPTWRAKRWATKQVKRKAAALGIPLKKKFGALDAGYENSDAVEYRLLPALEECWVSPTVGDLRKGVILDKGF